MKKLLLLFVLSAGLFGCSENQDLFIEEAVVAGKQKEKNAQVLSKDEDWCCGDFEDDIAIVETEREPYKQVKERIEQAALDRMKPGDIGPTYTMSELLQLSRVIPPYNMYTEMLEGLREEYNMCISL